MISIIVLNWNTTDMTLRLYESLKKTTSGNFNFYVLDNGSSDIEYKKLFALFRENEYVGRSQKNLGFAAGNNVLCRHVAKFNHGHVFFINSDIIIEQKDWDIEACKLLDNEKIGIVGLAYHPLHWDKTGHFHIQPKSDVPVLSESVQGAFFGVKDTLFNQLIRDDNSIFDENFKFAQYEETDLCFRVRKMNYQIYWLNVAHVHDHARSATKQHNYHLNDEIKNIDDFKKNTERNRILFVEKHKDIL